MSQRNRRGYLLGVLLALAAVGVLLLTGACRSTPALGWYGSDSLLINLEVLKHVPEVRYTVGDQRFVVRPSDSKNDLVVARLDVRNRAAATVFMDVTSDVLTLRNKKSPYEEYRAIDPLLQREELTDASPDDNKYMPFIWGSVELPQECPDVNNVMQTCRLYGWVVFEAPKGAQFNQMRWGTGETVFMNF